MDYSSGYGKNGSKEPLYQRDEFDDNDSNESEEIYIVRQKYGYISIFLSLIQGNCYSSESNLQKY